MDSIVYKKPDNCIISNGQLIWTFLDFEPTSNDDIEIKYNSNKILYTGKKPISPVYIVDENFNNEFDLKSLDPNNIVLIEVITSPKETRKYTNQNNGVVKIYTKDFILTKLKGLIKAKSKEKIVLPDYDQLKEEYLLFINEDKVDFTKIIDIKTESVAKLEIIHPKEEQSRIMVKLKKER